MKKELSKCLLTKRPALTFPIKKNRQAWMGKNSAKSSNILKITPCLSFPSFTLNTLMQKMLFFIQQPRFFKTPPMKILFKLNI